MIRVRCPYCRELLELDRPAPVFLCPACNNTCRLPAPQVPIRQALAVDQAEDEILDVVAVDEEPRRSRRADGITAEAPDDRPRGGRGGGSEEDVQLEVVEDGEERRRRKRRPRRRRRRSGGGTGIDLDWVNLPFVLLVALGFPGLIMVVLFFLVNPLAGLAAIPMIAGGIWFLVIVAEDGILELVLCMFVPFYSLYWTFNNFDRVAIPFLLQAIGTIGFVVSMGATASKARHMSAPAPVPVHVASLRPG